MLLIHQYQKTEGRLSQRSQLFTILLYMIMEWGEPTEKKHDCTWKWQQSSGRQPFSARCTNTITAERRAQFDCHHRRVRMCVCGCLCVRVSRPTWLSAFLQMGDKEDNNSKEPCQIDNPLNFFRKKKRKKERGVKCKNYGTFSPAELRRRQDLRIYVPPRCS